MEAIILYESRRWFICIDFDIWGLPFVFNYDPHEGHVFGLLCFHFMYNRAGKEEEDGKDTG